MSKPTRHKKHNTEQPVLARSARPTIGLLAANVSMVEVAYPNIVWNGVADAARERDANLICFAGGTLDFTPLGEFQVGSNVLYDLALDNADGLIISSGVLRIYASAEELQGFCDRYRSLPVVSIAVALEGIPSVLVDNVTGLRDAVSHLIEAHGYRRIAFIRGPEGHQEAEARYGAYVEALAAHGLALDPDLVAPGDFSSLSGAAAIHLLLDERKLRPGVDLEAVVASTDRMALGALDELHRRGIQVPYDVAIVGFDDAEEAKVAVPALTTVRQPVYEQAKRATDMVLALLAGDDVPEQVILPTEMVVRQSCGCHSQTVLQAAAGPGTGTEVSQGYSTGETFEETLVTRREEILAAMVQAVTSYSAETASAKTFEWAGQLLDSFAAAMREGAPASFLSALDQMLRQVVAVSDDDPSTGSAAGSPDGSGQSVTAWQGALSALRRHVLPWLSDDEALSRAENLWQQARLFIAEVAQQIQSYQQLQAERQTGVLQEIGQALITTFDVGELMDVIAQELPRLGIPSSYLSLYEHHPGLAEGGQEMPSQECRLILAYNQDGRIELEPGGQRFAFRELVPDGMLPQERRYAMVVEALYFKDDQLGFALFEAGPRGGTVYEVLQGQISSALQAALLSQQVRRHALQLQTAAEVSSTTSGVLDPSELTQQVVDLARERFDLYYAGLFLVDADSPSGESVGEPGASPRQQWAVLRAGTGEAGQQMMEQGHKLEVGSGSMIGWCIANRQARIALDVGAEAERFDNPYLPETRSEMALPLISRGEVIGALTVQSAEEAAFSGGDIAALQTMANQLANAIINARLFSETEAALEEAEALAREQAVLNEMSRALTAMLDVDAVVESIYVYTSRLLDTTNFNIALYDAQRDEVSSPLYAEGDEIRRTTSRRRAGKGMTEHIIRTREALLIKANVDEKLEELGIDLIETPAQSWLGVPMMVAQQVVGVIAIQSYTTPYVYDEHDRDLLGAIANQAAQALESARLFEEARTRVEEIAILNEMSRTLTSILDVDAATESIYQFTSRLMDTTSLYVALYDPEAEQVSFPVAIEQGERVQWQPRQLGKGLTEYIIRTGKPLLITENVNQWLEAHGVQSIGREAKTWLGAPMLIGEQVIGVIAVQSYTAHLYDEHHRELLSAVSSQTAIAIQNARLFQETTSRAEELAVLNELGQALTARLNVEQVLEEAYRQASRLIDTTNFYIGLYDPEKDEIHIRLEVTESEIDRDIHVIPADQGISGYIVRNRTSLFFEDNVREQQKALGITMVGQEALSWLGVPLITGARVLGVMGLQSFTTPRLYNEHSRDLLSAIASQVAIALQNAQQFEQAQARAQREGALRQITTIINASDNLAEDLDAIAEPLCEFTPADTVTLCSYTPGESEFIYHAVGQGALRAPDSSTGIRLPIRGSSVEWVIINQEPWIAQDLRQERRFSEEEQMVAAGLVARLVMPLRVRDQVIGTLDLGSSQPDVFTEEQVRFVERVAEQMALALERTRLLQETRAALATAEATHRRYLQEAWEGLLSAQSERVWGYTDGPEGMIPSDDIWSLEIEQAISSGKLQIVEQPVGDDGQNTRSGLAVPIRVRGQIIGVLDFSDEERRVWTEADKALVEELADQVALALENQRLFQQTQRRAYRERLAGEIVGKIRSASEVQNILETAAQELGRALGVSRARIRLGDLTNGSDQIDEQDNDHQQAIQDE